MSKIQRGVPPVNGRTAAFMGGGAMAGTLMVDEAMSVPPPALGPTALKVCKPGLALLGMVKLNVATPLASVKGSAMTTPSHRMLYFELGLKPLAEQVIVWPGATVVLLTLNVVVVTAPYGNVWAKTTPYVAKDRSASITKTTKTFLNISPPFSRLFGDSLPSVNLLTKS